MSQTASTRPSRTASEESDDDRGIPWRSSTVVAVLAATVVVPMDVPLISPGLPRVGSALGVSPSRAGLLVTVYAVPGVVLAPLLGALADRVGRTTVLAACLAGFGLAGTAVAVAPSFEVALAVRAVQGVTAGVVVLSLATTLVGDRFEGRRHDAAMGAATAALSLGTAIYPAVGGALSTVSWNAPFALYALAVPVALFVAFGVDEPSGGGAKSTGPTPETGWSTAGPCYVRAVLRAVPTGRLLPLLGGVLLAHLLLFGLYAAVPFYLEGAFGLGPATVGVATSGMLLLTALVSVQNGRLATLTSPRRLLAAGFACYAAGMLCLSVGAAGGLPVAAVGLATFGVGSGLVVPSLFTAISGLAPDRFRAGVMSVQTSAIAAGQAIGPAASTALGSATGFGPVFAGAGGLAALGCVVALTTVGGGRRAHERVGRTVRVGREPASGVEKRGQERGGEGE